MASIEGSAAHHSIITPTCRENRTDEGAWQEAVDRAKAEYDAIVQGWAASPEQPTLHLVLTVERPRATAPFTWRDIPHQPQRQDDLASQLDDLYSAAHRLGMYDAAGWLEPVLALLRDDRAGR